MGTGKVFVSLLMSSSYKIKVKELFYLCKFSGVVYFRVLMRVGEYKCVGGCVGTNNRLLVLHLNVAEGLEVFHHRDFETFFSFFIKSSVYLETISI